ncbi:MAG: NAD-dependent epimerase/dehydratase family protein [Crocinitomicaceae bacterium]|nr:NAD-dependent epimerase/dehydratase family protein [Crocinitomicaceae bacterium]
MKILVTGADGLLGNNLVRELLKRDHDVTAMIEEGKEPQALIGIDVKMVHGNILSPESMDALLEGADVVYHCAANISVWPAKSDIINKVNIDGTQNVIDACLKHSVKRMIFVGTANSFGSGKIDNLGNETNSYQAAHYGLDYMDSKRKAQEIVLEAVEKQGLPALVVNPTFLIGPYDSKPSSGAMILAIYNGKAPCYTHGGKNFVNVKDAAMAMANAATKGRIGECYILGHENLSYKEIFDKIGDVVGKKSPKRSLPNGVVKTYGKTSSIVAKMFKFTPAVTHELSILSTEDHYYSPKKAVEELEMPQTPVKDGIKECFAWFKENGYIKK